MDLAWICRQYCDANPEEPFPDTTAGQLALLLKGAPEAFPTYDISDRYWKHFAVSSACANFDTPTLVAEHARILMQPEDMLENDDRQWRQMVLDATNKEDAEGSLTVPFSCWTRCDSISGSRPSTLFPTRPRHVDSECSIDKSSRVWEGAALTIF
jgi:hypothetical protein